MGHSIKFTFETIADLASLYKIISALRGERGCPWDKKQTPHSLKKYLLEEVYEVLEAIEEKGPEEIQEELGDLLFITLFIIYLYEEQGLFSLKSLVYSTFNKMISRHPHVFGEEEVKSAEEVMKRWQEIKEREGKSSSILGDLPKGLPALQKAYRIGERVAKVGFDWDKPEEILDKIYEELEEVKTALKDPDKKKLEFELGDLLFTIANLVRKLEINPEEALTKALDKFVNRFKKMERLCKERGLSLESLSLGEMDRLWEEVKNQEK